MTTYRKKPVEIQAFIWTGSELTSDNTRWIRTATKDGIVWWEDEFLFIKTLEGVMVASPGDFIIKGVKGEIYPCKPDIFELTYEEVK